MLTLDILICSLNKGIVRVTDGMLPPMEGVRYIVSYQYTDERYLDLIPEALTERTDVTLYKYKGRGLSVNRNLALDRATADLVMYMDDDAHLLPDTPALIRSAFDEDFTLDMAFFCASTYTGKPLKHYPTESFVIKQLPSSYTVSALEMAFRRGKVQGKLRFDERFGLGAQFLTCGEDEMWLLAALKAKLRIVYFPHKIVETSTMLKKSLIYVDAGVQRSRGAITYYRYGLRAVPMSFHFAMESMRKGYCHFFPMFRHLIEGIRYMKATSR